MVSVVSIQEEKVEEDVSMEIEEASVGAKTEHITRFDLCGKVRSFLAELNINETSTVSLDFLSQESFTTLKSCAFEDEVKVATSDVLEALSLALGVPGLMNHIIKHFEPLLIELFGRWCLTNKEAQAEEWERKLFVMAEVSDLVPELWR